MDGSNLFSQSENLLLRWMEVHHENETGCNKFFNKEIIRLTNFDKDLRNSLVISSIIKSYVNTSQIRETLNLKINC